MRGFMEWGENEKLIWKIPKKKKKKKDNYY